MSSYSDPPVKRKRGRPPKKQPLDIYMSFTSQFQAMSGSSSPSAENNSNLMVKLGEPNSFTPVMKVSPSKLLGKRRRTSIGIQASSSSSKLHSPGSLSGSCSPSLKKFDTGLPTPLTVRSQVSSNSTVNLKLDDKVYDNMQKIIGLGPDYSQSYLRSTERSMSAHELPFASPELTPRQSLSSAHSDLEFYCRSLKLSPVKDDMNAGEGLGMTPDFERTKPTSCPEPCISFFPEEDAFSFNLVVDGRGRAAFSLEMPDESGFSSHPQESPSLHNQEPTLDVGGAADLSLSNVCSPAGHYILPQTSFNNIDRSVESDLFHDNSEDILDSRFRLTPHFNSSMNSLININSSLRPLMSELYLDTDNITYKQQSAANFMSNAKSYNADVTNLYKTINMNSLPCSEGGDARVALRRAFRKQ